MNQKNQKGGHYSYNKKKNSRDLDRYGDGSYQDSYKEQKKHQGKGKRKGRPRGR